MRFHDALLKVVGELRGYFRSSPIPKRASKEDSPFEPYDWRLRLFLAGAINWGLIRVLTITYWNTNFFYAPLVSSVIAPILLSIFLTQRLPNKRIVPISYIEAVTSGWLILTYFLWDTAQLIAIGFAVLYTGFLAYQGGTFFVGRAGQKDDIQCLSLIADCTPSTMKNLLLNDNLLRSAIGISDKPIWSSERTIFHSIAKTPHPTYVEIEPVEEEKNKCRINIAIFQQDKYTISSSEYFSELRDRDVPYFKSLLQKKKNLFKLKMMIQSMQKDCDNTSSKERHSV